MGVARFASATTITVACPTGGGSGVSGSSTSTCASAAGPVGAISLDSVTLTFKFDALFTPGGVGSVLENFDLLPLGNGDVLVVCSITPATRVLPMPCTTSRGAL